MVADAVAEEQVARLLGVRAGEARARAEAADLAQRAGEPERVAGELCRGGVGEELALARHRALDQSREEDADVADDQQREAEQEDGSRSALLAAARRRAAAVAAQDPVADQTDDQDAVENAHQADVEPPVAVEQMAHLVADHALQLVAIEQIERAARDADHGVVESEAGGERVDAVLVLEQVDGRDRGAGRERHLLDHVEQPAPGRVGGVGIERRSAQELRHRRAAAGERRHLVQARDADDGEGDGVMPPNASGRNRSRLDRRAADSMMSATARLTAATTPATASTNSTTSHRVPRRASSCRWKKSMASLAAAPATR